MKAGNVLFALLSALALMIMSCGTGDTDGDETPASDCRLSSYSGSFGNVPIGEHVSANFIVRASDRDEPHIQGAVTIDCPGFTFCDLASGEPVDSFTYDLDYPNDDTCCIRFEPGSVGDLSCDVDFGGDCGTLTLTGRGVDPSGGAWTLMAKNTQCDLYDIFMDQNGYGVIVGDSGTVLKKGAPVADFAAWVAHGFGDTKLKAVWKTGANRIFVAGGEITVDVGKIYEFVASWEEFDSDNLMEYYSAIWGIADCDIYFGGMGVMSTGGNLKHYDCSGLATVVLDLMVGMSEVSGISGSSSSDVWVVLRQPGNYHIYHYDGDVWTREGETGMSATLEDVYVSGNGEVFIVGSGGAIYHRDSEGWHDRSILGFDGSFYGVWGTSANDVFAVGSGASIYHYDGSTWTAQSVPPDLNRDLYSVWGSGSYDVWAVGKGGLVLHYH